MKGRERVLKKISFIVVVGLIVGSLTSVAIGAVDGNDTTAGANVSNSDNSIAAARTPWEAQHPGKGFDDQVAYHRDFRAQFDFLPDSDAVIAAVMSSAPRNGSFEQWGLHLTGLELAELNRRDRIETARPPITAAVMNTGLTEEDAYEDGLSNVEWMGPDFAGSWIDQMDGGKIKIAVKVGPGFESARGRATAVLNALVADGLVTETDVEFIAAQYSLAEITDAADAFFDGPHGESLYGFFYVPDFSRNALVIHAEPQVYDVAVEFASQYPEGMIIVESAPEGSTSPDTVAAPASNHSSPHAGVKIDLYRTSDGLWGGGCTWGFTARTTNFIYAISAYHCHPDYQTGVFKHGNTSDVRVVVGGQQVSNAGFSFSYNGERGEITRAQILSLSTTDDNNCYHADADCNASIVRRELTGETGVGETKCSSMRTTNDYKCGTVLSNDWRGTAEGIQRRWIRQINFHNQDGDSGSGWKESTLATAITNWRLNWPMNDTLATHMYYVETKLGVTTCGTSGAC